MLAGSAPPAAESQTSSGMVTTTTPSQARPAPSHFQRADRELQFDLPTPGGLPPFLLEDRDGERFEAHDADAATALSRKSSGP